MWRSSRSAFGQSIAGIYVVVANIFLIFFIPFFPCFSSLSQAFLVEGVLGSKNLAGAPTNLELDTFPDHVGYFGAPWRPFCKLCCVAGGV